MAWLDEDFEHEGSLLPRFADGCFGTGAVRDIITVTIGADGSWLPQSAWHTRPAAQVTGWASVCSCGWRSAPWTRVFAMLDEDRDGRCAFDEDAIGEAPTWTAEVAHQEWAAHIGALHDPLCPVHAGGECACVFIAAVRADQDARRQR